MNRHAVLILLLPLTLLAGCGKAATPDAGPAVATVNGKPITKSEFDLYIEEVSKQTKREISEADKSMLLDQFISMKLAAAEAEKSGVMKQPKVQDQLELAKLNVAMQVYLEKWLADHPIPDEELRPEYDAQVKELPREYHARHILVDDKAKADALIKQLQGGADFAKLAQKNSKDPSGKDGGDLGWQTQDAWVKPFGDAVSVLEVGAFTAAPVQSQFGWHVIKLDESRAANAPDFEQVKDRVKVMVQRKKLQQYLEDLRKNAKIEKKI